MEVSHSVDVLFCVISYWFFSLQ